MTLIPIPLPTPDTTYEWIRDAKVLIEQQREQLAELTNRLEISRQSVDEAIRQRDAAISTIGEQQKHIEQLRHNLRLRKEELNAIGEQLAEARTRATEYQRRLPRAALATNDEGGQP